MYSFRDLLVCGPVVVATSLLTNAGWALSLALGVILYVGLRLLSEVTGLEQAVRDRHNGKIAENMARQAAKASDARSSTGDSPPRKPS